MRDRLGAIRLNDGGDCAGNHYRFLEENLLSFMNYIDRIQNEGRDANPFFTLMGIEIGDIGKGARHSACRYVRTC